MQVSSSRSQNSIETAAAVLHSGFDHDRWQVFCLVVSPFFVAAALLLLSQTFRLRPTAPTIAAAPIEAPVVKQAAELGSAGPKSTGQLPTSPMPMGFMSPSRLPARPMSVGPMSVGPMPAGPMSTRVAAIDPAPVAGAPPVTPHMVQPRQPSRAKGPQDPFCAVAPPMPAAEHSVVSSLSPEEFGLRLAAAAREQLTDFVVYNDAYIAMSYPNGDVPKFYGVCTDVVVRAYRRLGIDLQALVVRARIGSGDRSIDHRRTETLRRLFSRYGESLPRSANPQDYKPGDIVTYDRPQNAWPRSRSHIAIVSDEVGPVQRPLIIHNRGSGPELEDALFFDTITGHYRFRGIEMAAKTARNEARPDAGVGGQLTQDGLKTLR